MKNPLVTVNILSYNRKDELKITLKKVFEQDYKNIEVIVVDNASTDGSPEMVASEFPEVRLIRLKKNIGIAGWNKGFEAAKGEYVLVLDDDAYPEKEAIHMSLNKMHHDSSIACITLNLFDLNNKNNTRTSWLPSERIEECFWPVFVGCAAFFRKKYCNLFPMPEDYFIYQHELPVSANIYNKGYKIFYHKKILAFHFFKDRTIYNSFADKYLFRNNLKFIASYLPLYLAFFYWLQTVTFYLTRAIRKKWLNEYLNILISIKPYEFNRNKISLKYFMKLRKHHYFNFPLFSKILK